MEATAVISVEGNWNILQLPEITAELAAAYRNGCTKVIVDFSKTTFFDSSVTRALSGVRRKVGQENFSAKNATGAVLSSLKTANLDEWLKE
jgi:anti-anti-sigma regulatory factor